MAAKIVSVQKQGDAMPPPYQLHELQRQYPVRLDGLRLYTKMADDPKRLLTDDEYKFARDEASNNDAELPQIAIRFVGNSLCVKRDELDSSALNEASAAVICLSEQIEESHRRQDNGNGVLRMHYARLAGLGELE